MNWNATRRYAVLAEAIEWESSFNFIFILLKFVFANQYRLPLPADSTVILLMWLISGRHIMS